MTSKTKATPGRPARRMTIGNALAIALVSVSLVAACGEGEDARGGRVKEDAAGTSLRPSDQRYEPTWSGDRSPGSARPDREAEKARR